MCNGRQLIRFHPQNRENYGRRLKRIRREVTSDDHRFPIPADSALSEARGQELISTPPPLVQFMKYVVNSLLVLLALKYQLNPMTLFRENPAPVWCFVGAISVYWLIVDKMTHMPTLNGIWFLILNHAAFATGILSTLSLISMFFRYPVSLVPLLIWIPVPVVFSWPKAYNLFHRGIKGVMDKIQLAVVVWAGAGGLNSTEEASNLPV